ncbi:MAG: ImmA/IrrE family metallo-endopeptidase [Polyangiales bacterium]
MTEIGDPEGLFFRLRWARQSPGKNAVEATRGELEAWIADALVWGAEEGGRTRGLEWTWIGLFEHLGRAWRYLEWEQSNPLGLAVHPDELRVSAERLWRDLPAADRDEQERALFEYEEAHNLAYGLDGLYPADLWLAREGELMSIASDGRRTLQLADDVLDALEHLGEQIFERLRHIKDDPRAKEALATWRQRDKLEPLEFAELVTGYSEEKLTQCSPSRDPIKGWGLEDELYENELLAAARMIGSGLPNEATRRLMQKLRGVGARETPELDELTSQAAEAFEKVSDELPHDQGVAMARWLRERLETAPEKRVDPEALLQSWGVQVADVDLGVASIDAIGAWGPEHGPAVVVNVSGKHANSRNGRRTTLAHEIGHLLLDREGALPLAEVFGGRVPVDVEPRARAFAVELLLPQVVAAEEIGAAPKAQLEHTVKRLSTRYRVSREVVAWQARNSGTPLPEGHMAYLRTLVSEPNRF